MLSWDINVPACQAGLVHAVKRIGMNAPLRFVTVSLPVPTVGSVLMVSMSSDATAKVLDTLEKIVKSMWMRLVRYLINSFSH